MTKETNNKHKNAGFTLIELLVVIAIIALLSSVALIALMSARQKSRDVKRLSDMTQMNTALEMYYSANRGYPSQTFSGSGIPDDLIPAVTVKIPDAPTPADGNCASMVHPLFVGDPVTLGNDANSYFYYPSGTAYILNGKTLYPDYAYYFCLGNITGNFSSGLRILTPHGVQ